MLLKFIYNYINLSPEFKEKKKNSNHPLVSLEDLKGKET